MFKPALISLALILAVAAPVLADAGAVIVEPFIDAGPQDAGVASGPASVLPDPVEAPGDSAGLLYKLYKAGHLIPAIIVFAFFGLTLAQRWVGWLKTGYRKLAVASALAGLAMLAERAADGTTPNLTMLMGAVGVAFALYVKGEGEPKQAA